MPASDYERVARAIEFIDADRQRQPELSDIAAHVGLGPHYFQRLFKRFAGVSPKRFLQFLTLEHAKELLAESSVLDAALDAGLSGPGRLHDLFVSLEAVTPGEFKSNGKALAIDSGIHPSPFGDCAIAVTARGVCGLEFVAGRSREEALASLAARWPVATVRRDQRGTRARRRADLQRLKAVERGATASPGARDQLSDPGLAGAPFRAARTPDKLLRPRRAHRPPAGRPRRRDGRRRQPHLLSHPLPPRHPQVRPHQRLRLGPHAQAGDPGVGSGADGRAGGGGPRMTQMAGK